VDENDMLVDTNDSPLILANVDVSATIAAEIANDKKVNGTN
jgi:hypothetical protein